MATRLSRRRVSCRELGQPDCDGWLLLRKAAGGFMGPRWRRCWFVLKRHTLYWYRQPQVSATPHPNTGQQVSQSRGSCPYSTIHSICGHRQAADPPAPRALVWKSSLGKVSRAVQKESRLFCPPLLPLLLLCLS